MAIEEGQIDFAKELNTSLKILGVEAKPRILDRLFTSPLCKVGFGISKN